MLAEADLEELTHRLVLYASWLVRKHVWRPGTARPPVGLLARDLVQEAFVKLLTGQRQRHKPVSLFQLLAGIIRSQVSHLGNSIESRLPHQPIVDPGETGGVTPDELVDPDVGVERRLIAGEWLEKLLELFGDDSRMRRYISLLTQEFCEDAAAYAAELGVSRTEIYNLNRRLARCLGKKDLP
ncbi:MAG TPA: hypothetical protein VGF69_19760 [Thermoanaerobaculia bacterium]|jgi:DNA-directed RNA polymerase specialized sigma24 family protein